MNPERYMNVLRGNSNKILRKRRRLEQLYFSNRSTTTSTHRKTKEHILYNARRILPTTLQSLDRNSIENLWALVKFKIWKYSCSFRKEFAYSQSLGRNWSWGDQEACGIYANYYCNILQAVINTKWCPKIY